MSRGFASSWQITKVFLVGTVSWGNGKAYCDNFFTSLYFYPRWVMIVGWPTASGPLIVIHPAFQAQVGGGWWWNERGNHKSSSSSFSFLHFFDLHDFFFVVFSSPHRRKMTFPVKSASKSLSFFHLRLVCVLICASTRCRNFFPLRGSPQILSFKCSPSSHQWRVS